MKRHSLILKLVVLWGLLFASCADGNDDVVDDHSTPEELPTTDVSIKVICTSDVHGLLYLGNTITNYIHECDLSRVASYMHNQRDRFGDDLLLFDAGDILEGTAEIYYDMYIDEKPAKNVAEMYNWFGYDVITLGNHDLAAGQDLCNRFASYLDADVVAANIVKTGTDQPYYKPYTIIERENVRFAVMGMTVESNKSRYQASLLSEMDFKDMEESAAYWMNYIEQHEHPDIVIGLFHVGNEGKNCTADEEYATYHIAQTVPGFDVIFYGHDHDKNKEYVVNTAGEKVLILNPGNNAYNVVDCTFDLKVDTQGNVKERNIVGNFVDMSLWDWDKEWTDRYVEHLNQIFYYYQAKLCDLGTTLDMRDHYFGPCAMMTFLGDVQRSVIDSDIQFVTAPTRQPRINQGEATYANFYSMFSYMIYRYSALRMTGEEIRNYLERSCDLWFNTMTGENDHLIRMNAEGGMATSYYTTIEAQGINYEVHVDQPDGSKVKILSMADGSAFDESKEYVVSMNSYLAHDDGKHLLTQGAGLTQEDYIRDRVVAENNIDHFRASVEFLKGRKYTPKVVYNWTILPADWAQEAGQRDYQALFGR